MKRYHVWLQATYCTTVEADDQTTAVGAAITEALAAKANWHPEDVVVLSTTRDASPAYKPVGYVEAGYVETMRVLHADDGHVVTATRDHPVHQGGVWTIAHLSGDEAPVAGTPEQG